MNQQPLTAELKAQRERFVAMGVDPTKADALIDALSQSIETSNKHIAQMEQKMERLRKEIDEIRGINP
jgi:peptidoglycan hydrolase CwlO-like protein